MIHAIEADLVSAPTIIAIHCQVGDRLIPRYAGNDMHSEGCQPPTPVPQGRMGQPMVNQSSNVVVIETESGLRGIGEGGEPTGMEECASMLIGMDPFRIDNLWQRMMRGYF